MSHVSMLKSVAIATAFFLVIGLCGLSFAEGTARVSNNGPGHRVRSAAEHPLAITKDGFFRGIAKGRITLQDMKSYRENSYRLDENWRLMYDNEEIGLDQVPPDSIVRVIMIEGQVREVILLQRSS